MSFCIAYKGIILLLLIDIILNFISGGFKMKKVLAGALAGLTLMVGSVLAVDGKTVFQSKGCVGCHQPQTPATGPSLKDIATKYNGNKADLIKFLKGQAKPKVEPGKFAIMKPQLNTTKALSDKELNALVDYILSNK